MISIVELIGGISILLASGFLLIFVKESVFDQTSNAKIEYSSSPKEESFITIDMDSLSVGKNTSSSKEAMERKKRIEAFRHRNKFYQIQ